jgi:hypothetical protein
MTDIEERLACNGDAGTAEKRHKMLLVPLRSRRTLPAKTTRPLVPMRSRKTTGPRKTRPLGRSPFPALPKVTSTRSPARLRSISTPSAARNEDRGGPPFHGPRWSPVDYFFLGTWARILRSDRKWPRRGSVPAHTQKSSNF